MLSEAPINASNVRRSIDFQNKANFLINFFPQDSPTDHPPSKMNEEKKQREHLLQLNQILAQQVMQMSKIVAGKLTNNAKFKEQFLCCECNL